MGQAGAIDSTALPQEAVTERGVSIHFDPADLHLMDTRVALEPAPLAAFNLSVRSAELSAQPGFNRLLSLPLVREMETLRALDETDRQSPDHGPGRLFQPARRGRPNLRRPV